MTDLQLGLIGLGAAIVGGIFSYNKWVEYRHRRLAKAVLKPDHDDVLLDNTSDASAPTEKKSIRERHEPVLERHEPVLGDLDGAEAGQEPDAGEIENSWPEAAAAESVSVDRADFSQQATLADELSCLEGLPPAPPLGMATPQSETREEKRLTPPPVPAALLDPAMDFVVVMELVEATSGHQILAGRRDMLARIGKPVRWVGYNERTREWERFDVSSEHTYRSLRIGLQLADRRGPLGEADHSLFLTMIRELADEVMAVADMHDGNVVEQALILDRFCADVDIEIGVNLVCRAGAFSGTKVRALAEAAGMLLSEEGYFIRLDDEGRRVFSMQNMESAPFTAEGIKSINTHGLTFLIDVPRVDQGERAFVQMLEQARRFADVLQGALVDDNRQPLGETQLDHIRREYIAKPQAAMSRRGFPAGGPQARRLFA